MLESLKQFTGKNICLSCKGCCRFQKSESCFRPQTFEEEYCAHPSISQNIDEEGRIKAKEQEGKSLCVFLAPDNKCTIYGDRPFECRLYPVMLVAREGKIDVCLHLACPFVQDRTALQIEEYAQYLKEYFQKAEVKDFIIQNRSIINDYKEYKDEFQNIFSID